MSTSTLDAVNDILEVIGEPPVTALDTAGTSDEAEAETFLNRWTTRVLREGWFQNTIIEKKYTPDGSDLVLLTDVLSFTHTAYSAYLPIAMRNGYMYDTENNRNTWPDISSTKLNVVLDIDFDDLTDGLRNYIIAKAAFYFERYKKRGVVDYQMTSQMVDEARGSAMQEDGDMRQTNLLDTTEAKNVLGDRRHNKAYQGTQ